MVRKGAKVSLFAATKLLNFYCIAGINFQNMALNDALISSKNQCFSGLRLEISLCNFFCLK